MPARSGGLIIAITTRGEHRSQPGDFTSGDAMKKLTLLGVALGAALLAATPVSFHWSPAKTLSLSLETADAKVGRPLTPGSVAGVNRRVHRRAYYGAAAGAAAVVAYGGYARPACGYYPYPPCY
jgi:hypothetical protein